MIACGKAPGRIVGGGPVTKNSIPWQVGLVSSIGTRPWCGGTLISNEHVLTAAHCVDGRLLSSISVLVGEHRTDDNFFTIIPLLAINNHPDYNARVNKFDNDYSILTLATPVEFSARIAPACLPSDVTRDFVGELATVSGWGKLSYRGYMSYVPNVLHEVDVTVQSNAWCKYVYGSSSITRLVVKMQ